MDKLGVVIDDNKDKTASKEARCPKCGEEVHYDPHRNTPWCQNCGTEPFEKKAER